MDGVCSGVVQFATAEDCLDWLQAISSNISSLTKHNVSMRQSRSLASPALARLHAGRRHTAAAFQRCDDLTGALRVTSLSRYTVTISPAAAKYIYLRGPAVLAAISHNAE